MKITSQSFRKKFHQNSATIKLSMIRQVLPIFFFILSNMISTDEKENEGKYIIITNMFTNKTQKFAAVAHNNYLQRKFGKLKMKKNENRQKIPTLHVSRSIKTLLSFINNANYHIKCKSSRYNANFVTSYPKNRKKTCLKIMNSQKYENIVHFRINNSFIIILDYIISS